MNFIQLPNDIISFITRYLDNGNLIMLHRSHPRFHNIHRCRQIAIAKFPRDRYLVDLSREKEEFIANISLEGSGGSFFNISQLTRFATTPIKKILYFGNGGVLTLLYNGTIITEMGKGSFSPTHDRFDEGKIGKSLDVAHSGVSGNLLFILTELGIWMGTNNPWKSNKVSEGNTHIYLWKRDLQSDTLPSSIFGSHNGFIYQQDRNIIHMDDVKSFQPKIIYELECGVDLWKTVHNGSETLILLSNSQTFKLIGSDIIEDRACIDIATDGSKFFYLLHDGSIDIDSDLLFSGNDYHGDFMDVRQHEIKDKTIRVEGVISLEDISFFSLQSLLNEVMAFTRDGKMFLIRKYNQGYHMIYLKRYDNEKFYMAVSL